MQLGLGLPTRFPTSLAGADEHEPDAEKPNELVRIKLFKCGERGERERATYQNILDIGQDESESADFHWLWRSQIRDYDRHARIFQRWIGRTLLFWNRLRYNLEKEWMSGFRIYDALEQSDANFFKEHHIESLAFFAKRCDFFLAELKDATLLSGGKRILH